MHIANNNKITCKTIRISLDSEKEFNRFCEIFIDLLRFFIDLRRFSQIFIDLKLTFDGDSTIFFQRTRKRSNTEPQGVKLRISHTNR